MPDHNTITKRLLNDAGISHGMRVLDVGSGPGEVSLLLADLVGESGEVIGLERDDKSIARARERVADLGISNVRFLQVDLSETSFDLPEVDAIVGRRVLMYLPSPAQTLTKLAAALRPGGLVVFEETDATMTPAHTSSFPIHDQAIRWLLETVVKEGGNTHIGFALPSVFGDAGLTVEHIRAEAVIEGQGLNYRLADIIQWVKHRIIAHGVATEEEIDADNLAEKLQAERAPHEVYISGMAFGIWGRSQHK